MSPITDILKDTEHRPYPLPKSGWTYYQEWNRALFLHYKVPHDSLRNLVPTNLSLDSYNGDYYISLVAFTMEKIRPKQLPAISLISDFDEINVRTYVEKNGKKGVYFLNIEAGKLLSAMVAKHLSGLPYEFATMKRTDNQYISNNTKKNFHLDVSFEVGEIITKKTPLDLWLTERYCLFLEVKDSLFRYDIHHKEWEIKTLNINTLDLNYQLQDIHVSPSYNLCHYSDGVQVVSWNRVKL